MLPYFLEPFPDETFYSILCRYHLLYGVSSPLHTMRRIFGDVKVKKAHPLPNIIGRFFLYFGISDENYMLDFISKTTFCPLYRIWVSNKDYNILQHCIIRNTRMHIYDEYYFDLHYKSEYSSVKFCPFCITNDKIYYGVSYWHRSHQMPGVILCHKHNEPLRIQRFANPRRFHPEPLDLPDSIQKLHSPSRILAIDDKIFRANKRYARKIADFTYGMLNNSSDINMASMDAALRHKLKSRGYTPKMFEDRRFTEMVARYADGLSELGYRWLSVCHFDSFSGAKILANGRKEYNGRYVLSDLVQISFLFHSYDEFKSCVLANNSDSSLEKNPYSSQSTLATPFRFFPEPIASKSVSSDVQLGISFKYERCVKSDLKKQKQ